uniref:Uncharacterized protein n=1 Tax=Chromera velia CCMP2878 TaxID=1169474 RepID=A0A0G4G9N6_9ALVE|eukprot:Cvel_20886.t1-p1 / transcript=Cvel_20886.t1 / gene=Cvel_20886 / organism=Chromera_velia_CCMP2878 / gene_product=hypothetical protein / transcript_product=hypothetical protein / location=Cvel_scaffold1915:6461-11214(+) / protein_length=1416 / sequence_SO=supercontig / SO=protein_coding / is_pseudo=false
MEVSNALPQLGGAMGGEQAGMLGTGDLSPVPRQISFSPDEPSEAVWVDSTASVPGPSKTNEREGGGSFGPDSIRQQHSKMTSTVGGGGTHHKFQLNLSVASACPGVSGCYATTDSQTDTTTVNRLGGARMVRERERDDEHGANVLERPTSAVPDRQRVLDLESDGSFLGSPKSSCAHGGGRGNFPVSTQLPRLAPAPLRIPPPQPPSACQRTPPPCRSCPGPAEAAPSSSHGCNGPRGGDPQNLTCWRSGRPCPPQLLERRVDYHRKRGEGILKREHTEEGEDAQGRRETGRGRGDVGTESPNSRKSFQLHHVCLHSPTASVAASVSACPSVPPGACGAAHADHIHHRVVPPCPRSPSAEASSGGGAGIPKHLEGVVRGICDVVAWSASQKGLILPDDVFTRVAAVVRKRDAVGRPLLGGGNNGRVPSLSGSSSSSSSSSESGKSGASSARSKDGESGSDGGLIRDFPGPSAATITFRQNGLGGEGGRRRSAGGREESHKRERREGDEEYHRERRESSPSRRERGRERGREREKERGERKGRDKRRSSKSGILRRDSGEGSASGLFRPATPDKHRRGGRDRSKRRSSSSPFAVQPFPPSREKDDPGGSQAAPSNPSAAADTADLSKTQQGPDRDREESQGAARRISVDHFKNVQPDLDHAAPPPTHFGGPTASSTSSSSVQPGSLPPAPAPGPPPRAPTFGSAPAPADLHPAMEMRRKSDFAPAPFHAGGEPSNADRRGQQETAAPPPDLSSSGGGSRVAPLCQVPVDFPATCGGNHVFGSGAVVRRNVDGLAVFRRRGLGGGVQQRDGERSCSPPVSVRVAPCEEPPHLGCGGGAPVAARCGSAPCDAGRRVESPCGRAHWHPHCPSTLNRHRHHHHHHSHRPCSRHCSRGRRRHRKCSDRTPSPSCSCCSYTHSRSVSCCSSRSLSPCSWRSVRRCSRGRGRRKCHDYCSDSSSSCCSPRSRRERGYRDRYTGRFVRHSVIPRQPPWAFPVHPGHRGHAGPWRGDWGPTSYPYPYPWPGSPPPWHSSPPPPVAVPICPPRPAPPPCRPSCPPPKTTPCIPPSPPRVTPLPASCPPQRTGLYHNPPGQPCQPPVEHPAIPTLGMKSPHPPLAVSDPPAGPGTQAEDLHTTCAGAPTQCPGSTVQCGGATVSGPREVGQPCDTTERVITGGCSHVLTYVKIPTAIRPQRPPDPFRVRRDIEKRKADREVLKSQGVEEDVPTEQVLQFSPMAQSPAGTDVLERQSVRSDTSSPSPKSPRKGSAKPVSSARKKSTAASDAGSVKSAGGRRATFNEKEKAGAKGKAKSGGKSSSAAPKRSGRASSAASNDSAQPVATDRPGGGDMNVQREAKERAEVREMFSDEPALSIDSSSSWQFPAVAAAFMSSPAAAAQSSTPAEAWEPQTQPVLTLSPISGKQA